MSTSSPPSGASASLAEADTIAGPHSPRPANAYRVVAGTLLADKYRVVRTLGRGGMGTVVEAFHLELQVPVAIKLLLPELMPYAEAAIRFQREARAVTRLTSPHVARVFDVDTLPSGEPFIVMELLKGQDLAARGKETIPLSVGEAVDYVVQACDALAEAHAVGIVHRDIKPANLFSTTRADGEHLVKVLDFGVSKVLSGSTGEVSLTQTTTILGSALYMSPEQMRSARDVDHRTDIYALGACLYELLARRPPYIAASFPELCALVYSGPPMSVTEWSPDAPEGLAKVIEKSLAHEPDARFGSVAELVHALAPYAEEATRKRIDAILKRHAPHLELPPVARRRRSLEPVFESEEGGASRRGASRLAVALLFAIGLGGLGIALRSKLPWASLRGEPAAATAGTATATATATVTIPAAATVTIPATATATATTTTTATADAASSGSTAAAASASVPVRSSAAASATAPVRPPSTAGAGQTTSSTPPRGEPSPPDPSVVARPGQPVINPGLGEQTCYAIMPDGTQKTVPCP
jgi:serine/threonine protein kinase